MMTTELPDSVEEFVLNAEKYGFCTFEEFKKNPGKWRKKDDDLLASADKGGKIINEVAQKFYYELGGYRTTSLTEIERIAKSEGVKIKDYRASLLPGLAGKADILIQFSTE